MLDEPSMSWLCSATSRSELELILAILGSKPVCQGDTYIIATQLCLKKQWWCEKAIVENKLFKVGWMFTHLKNTIWDTMHRGKSKRADEAMYQICRKYYDTLPPF